MCSLESINGPCVRLANSICLWMHDKQGYNDPVMAFQPLTFILLGKKPWDEHSNVRGFNTESARPVWNKEMIQCKVVAYISCITKPAVNELNPQGQC